MIIVHLMGGLGNQLFQYATGRRLAEKHHSELKFDTESYRNDKQRALSLLPFCIKGSEAAKEEIKALKTKDAYLNLLPGIRKVLPVKFKKILRSPAFGFNKQVIKGGREHYLFGYWAHEKYFKDIRSILLQDLTLKAEYQTQEFIAAQKRLQQENSISIHIRRGDYANSSTIKSYFGLMPLSYYEKAIEKIQEKSESPVFTVFTDDVNWVRENLKTKIHLNFIQDAGCFTDYQELVLMSCCKHNIIANSTFSWWGAWLNQNKWKIVIAPKRWYNDPYAQANYERNGFIPSNWIKL